MPFGHQQRWLCILGGNRSSLILCGAKAVLENIY